MESHNFCERVHISLDLVHLMATAKNLRQKKKQKLWKCIIKASRRVSFSDFPKVALSHGGFP